MEVSKISKRPLVTRQSEIHLTIVFREAADRSIGSSNGELL